jgi:Tol biopolymer transport system component
VFVSNRSETRDLYLLGIDQGRASGDPQLLRRNIGPAGDLRMTRDGRLFRFEDTSTTNSLIVSVDEHTGKLTGSPSPVDPNYPEAAWPGWSADGKLLYYQVIKGPSNDKSRVLFVRSEGAGETREITPKPRLGIWNNPSLSPDGRQFAVAGADLNGNQGVYAIDSESGDVSQLWKIPGPGLGPVNPVPNWSPDGKSIFYNVRLPDKVQGKTIATRRRDLATGAETDFPRGHHIDLKISPDGTRLAYVQSDGATKSWFLGVLDVRSGTELELWRVPEAEGPDIKTPAWTPDGRYVLVARDLKQGSDLWRFPAAGGPGEKLHVFADPTWGFVLHPSGKRMAFTQARRNCEVWVLENFLPAAKATGKH